MPGGWSKPRDVARLADSRAEFAYEIPSAELLAGREGYADAGEPFGFEARFGRLQGFAIADVQLRGAVRTTCQRCLRPMRLAVQSESRVALLDQASLNAEVPESWETFLAVNGELTLGDLAGEELLLALPLVARHEGAADCAEVRELPLAATSDSAADGEDDERTQRPFAGLRALLDDAGRD